jgi:hypothetical protein
MFAVKQREASKAEVQIRVRGHPEKDARQKRIKAIRGSGISESGIQEHCKRYANHKKGIK